MANGDRFKVPPDTAEKLWVVFSGKDAEAELMGIQHDLAGIHHELQGLAAHMMLK